MDLWDEFRAARRVSTPLVALSTPDQHGLVEQFSERLGSQTLVFELDAARALVGTTAVARTWLQSEYPKDAPTDLRDVCCELLPRLPEDSVVFCHNSQRWINDTVTAQAICNLRDLYKRTGRMIILLAPYLDLPLELGTDALVLAQSLPGDSDLSRIVDAVAEASGAQTLVAVETHRRAVEAIRGLSGFAAENAVAWSMTPAGIDLERLWSVKRRAVEQTQGIRFANSQHTFDDVGGLEGFQLIIRRMAAGPRPISCVVHIDEIDKAMTGATGPTGDSGVAADRLDQILQFMQSHHIRGSLLVGVPGSGKTYITEAVGNTLNVPTLRMDLGGMMGGIMGESQAKIRAALAVVLAVGGVDAIFLATCNRLDSLPSELRRRFNIGPVFFDLPTPAERAAVWQLNLKRYEMTHMERPEDRDWTSADVTNCVANAWQLGVTLLEAAELVVPVARQDPQGVAALRDLAHEKFLSAARWGKYQKPDGIVDGISRARKIGLE